MMAIYLLLKSKNRLWFFPLIFGIIGTLIGLLLRLAFTGVSLPVLFKNVLHAHSHVMLLGLLFNSLLLFIWKYFTNGIDKTSIKYYLALQGLLVLMIIAFIIQGYALFSILFSTLHLWISYIILIRLWKRLEKNDKWIYLVKAGIVFYFVSSLGPYALGPLMALKMKGSAWYQQAIFFYLHFQFLGVYFSWLLALLFKKAKVPLNKKKAIVLVISLILLYAHSLDYSFNHWSIQFVGGLSSMLLFGVLITFWKTFQTKTAYLKNIYYLVLSVAIINIIGTFPIFADLVLHSRFVLIAWLHYLFLGLYLPFIWAFIDKKIKMITWIVYGISFLVSEVLLVFHRLISNWFSFSVYILLFFAYLGVFLSLIYVHSKILLQSNKSDL